MRRFLPLILAMALLAAACSSSDTASSDTASSDTASSDTASSDGASSDSAATAKAPGAGASTDTDWPYQFSTKTVDGSLLDTGDYAGQDLVLWFWAPW